LVIEQRFAQAYDPGARLATIGVIRRGRLGLTHIR
jgi:hypothetical protein